MDNSTNLQALKQSVKDFCEDRDWDQFHNIKDLSLALSIESAELLEIFRWKDAGELKALLSKPEKVEAVSDEMADIFFFLLRISQMYDIDLSKGLQNKIKKNALKYPIEKSRGKNNKYNELD